MRVWRTVYGHPPLLQFRVIQFDGKGVLIACHLAPVLVIADNPDAVRNKSRPRPGETHIMLCYILILCFTMLYYYVLLCYVTTQCTAYSMLSYIIP